jgi:hypothetical protein
MRDPVVMVAACCLLALACGSSAGTGDGGAFHKDASAPLTAQESHACSIFPDDDPQLVCSTGQDLVCITTYSRHVTDPQDAVRFDGGLRQVFVCRFPCGNAADCPPGDVCCPGTIFGKTFGKMAGCVPPGSCETAPGPDGGP